MSLNDIKLIEKELNIPLGINENGLQEFFNLNKARNVLIAGKTGSGKSTFLHKAIKYLTENYCNAVDLCLIDLKQTEFSNYNNVIFTLNNAITFLSKVVENINDASLKNEIPLIIIVDECAELLLDKKAFNFLTKIAAMGRRINVNLILSTQRTSFKVLPPVLKANLQTKICFPVHDKTASLSIVNEQGAENLNTGEFLYKSPLLLNLKKYKIEI